MHDPIYEGEVSPDAESWYQLDYYDRPSGFLPWMVSSFDDLYLALQCFNFAQELSKGFTFGHYQNLYLVRRDGTYQCLRTNAPDEHTRSIEPYGTRARVALHQLRMAGVYHG